MKRIIAVILCAACLFALAGCKSDRGDPVTIKEPNEKGVKVTMTGNEFDDKLLSFAASTAEGNYMISPLSFRYALGLLLAGAEGETKDELLSALGVNDVEEWTDFCLKFAGFIDRYDDSLERDIAEHNLYKKDMERMGIPAPFRALRVANSIWKNENIGRDFKDDYKRYVSDNYDAEYNTFNPENAVTKINDWASEKTEKMIPKLLPENYDASNLGVVLMNALYFKDSWINTFDKYATASDDFHTKSGETVKKDFMHQTEDLNYYADKDTQIVILPMEGGVNMAFVLGDRADLAEKISMCSSQRVDVKIPKIDMETSFDKKEFINFLKINGASAAFDKEKADFSAMIDEQIWVDDIIQKTKIKTDENGVEAAAVTSIMAMATGMIEQDDIVEFVADRPFSFYIYASIDDITAVLFAGEVVE
ncbi:MAG: hypothetical protein IJL87_03440 [Clostridia bacterium]|nr:hypothetical protein [Clostridia bacterium]